PASPAGGGTPPNGSPTASTAPGATPGATTAASPDAASASQPPTPLTAASPTDSLAASTPARAPRTDNLAALEMGGRVAFLSRDVGDFSRIHLLDGNPSTIWLTGVPFPQEAIISFLNFESTVVSGVTLSTPPRGVIPLTDKPNDPAWPKDVEISTSMESATAGFRKVATATLPQEPGD